MKNKTNVRLTQKQFNVINLLGDNYKLCQKGSKTGHLVKNDDGVENFCQNNVLSVGYPTIRTLVKKNLIEVTERKNWLKYFSLTDKGFNVLMSLIN